MESMKTMIIGDSLVTIQNKKINIHLTQSPNSEVIKSFDEDECDILLTLILKLKSLSTTDVDLRIPGVGC